MKVSRMHKIQNKMKELKATKFVKASLATWQRKIRFWKKREKHGAKGKSWYEEKVIGVYDIVCKIKKKNKRKKPHTFG